MLYYRNYQVVGKEEVVYSRYSEDYDDDILWELEEGKFWIMEKPLAMGDTL